MIEFYFPSSGGEWAAFVSAAATALLGLVFLLAPRPCLHRLGLDPRADKPAAVAEGRARLSGFHLGLGLCCALLAQPLLYLALGAAWAVTAFGRLVSIVVDRAGTPFNWMVLAVEIVLCAGPLLYAFGMI